MKNSKIAMTLCLVMTAALFAKRHSTTEDLVKDSERAKAYTHQNMETMPADRLDLKPTGQVRSFAQQIHHITDAYKRFAATTTDPPSDIGKGGCEKTGDISKEDVYKLVLAGYDVVLAQLKGIDAVSLDEK